MLQSCRSAPSSRVYNDPLPSCQILLGKGIYYIDMQRSRSNSVMVSKHIQIILCIWAVLKVTKSNQRITLKIWDFTSALEASYCGSKRFGCCLILWTFETKPPIFTLKFLSSWNLNIVKLGFLIKLNINYLNNGKNEVE